MDRTTVTINARLREAVKAQRRLNIREAEAAKAGALRDRAVLAAQEAGASRAQLEEATGLSPARITQVLRKAKAAATIDA